MCNLEGPARALIISGNADDAISRAEAAVELAPALPAVHAALAAARLRAGDVRGALSGVLAAIAAIPGHLEARAWALAAVSAATGKAAFLWALAFSLLGAIASLPHLLHGLGSTRLGWRGPVSLAALAAAVLALGWLAGPLGALIGLAGVAAAHGGAVKRAAVAVTAALAVFVLFASSEREALGRVALSADAVALAAHRVEAGLATPADLGVVLRAASRDPLAARAAALREKRGGDLLSARDYFAHALREFEDAEIHNNAANVDFKLGDMTRAIGHYEKSVRLAPAPVAYFNLAQAYGRAVRLDEQDRALTSAQAIDAQVIARFTDLATSAERPFVADIPISVDAVLARTADTGAPAQLARALRARVAYGFAGDSLSAALALLGVVLALGIAGGTALGRSAGPRDFYADLARTLRAGVGDSSQRVAQLTRLKRQRARNDAVLTALAFVVPGAAGFRFGRPLCAWLATLAFALGITGLGAVAAAPADPLAVGALPGLVVPVVLGFAVVLYAASTAAAFLMKAED
jgi:tetratricopeptide (TPR) repeat protein